MHRHHPRPRRTRHANEPESRRYANSPPCASPGGTMNDYATERRDYRWDCPPRFNFARDVIDRWAAADPAQPAMLWVDDHGREERRTFRRYCRRLAPRRQRAGRRGRGTRRPRRDAAGPADRVVGSADRLPAHGRCREPRHRAALGEGSRLPHQRGRSHLRGDRHRECRESRRGARRMPEPEGARAGRWLARGLDRLRHRGARGIGGVRHGRQRGAGRGAVLFHLRHHGSAEDVHARACLRAGAPEHGALLARPEALGPALELQRHRLGQGRVEQLFRAVELRRGDLRAPHAGLQRQAHAANCWRRSRSPPSAARRPSTACSCRRISRATASPACATASAPANR